MELGRLLGPLCMVLRRRRWCTVSLAAAGSALTVVCALAERVLHDPSWLTDATAERASLPMTIALERLPGSLFAPAPDLPLWGAVAQLALAAAVAQAVCGAARAVGVGLGAHVTATLVARVTLALGPLVPLAMPAATRFVLDTGPSAASLGLAAYVCTRLRCGVVLAMLAAEPVVELCIRPTTLAAHEHGAAVTIGALVALLSGRRRDDWPPTAGNALRPTAPCTDGRRPAALGVPGRVRIARASWLNPAASRSAATTSRHVAASDCRRILAVEGNRPPTARPATRTWPAAGPRRQATCG